MTAALLRLADEVCLPTHLLYLSWMQTMSPRTDSVTAQGMYTARLMGIGAVTAERIRAALDLPDGIKGALQVLRLHPLLNPAAYVSSRSNRGALVIQPSPAHQDKAWISGPLTIRALQAVVRAVDPTLDVEIVGTDESWEAFVTDGHRPA